MVALSQPPSSEIEVRVFPSGVTCRSDQPPKLRELAVIEMPPRQIRRPTLVAAGSSLLRCRARLWMSSACSCAPARRQGRAGTGGGQQANDEEGADGGVQGAPV